jgi:hypothetical protein
MPPPELANAARDAITVPIQRPTPNAAPDAPTEPAQPSTMLDDRTPPSEPAGYRAPGVRGGLPTPTATTGVSLDGRLWRWIWRRQRNAIIAAVIVLTVALIGLSACAASRTPQETATAPTTPSGPVANHRTETSTVAPPVAEGALDGFAANPRPDQHRHGVNRDDGHEEPHFDV